MTEPAVGLQASIELVVGADDTALALGSGDVEVLGTPRVVALVEEAAVAALAGTLPDGQTTVGTRIDLQHLAPSPVGSAVVASATVTSVDGRKLGFDVAATMDGSEVARGTHDRVMVRREGFGG